MNHEGKNPLDFNPGSVKAKITLCRMEDTDYFRSFLTLVWVYFESLLINKLRIWAVEINFCRLNPASAWTIQSRLDMEIGQFMGSLCSTAVGTRWCPLSSYQSCFVSRFTIWFTVDISTVYFIGIFSTNRNTPGTPPCIGNIQLLILVGQLDPSQYQHQYPTKPYLLNCQVKLINLPLKGGFSQTYNCFYTFTTKPF